MAIQPKKNEMPVQDAQIRARNFKEVALGYSAETAVVEAQRCLNCKNRPCVEGCPVNISIPEFIAKIKQNDFEGAYSVISKALRCLRFADVSARRKPSVKANVRLVLSLNP